MNAIPFSVKSKLHNQYIVVNNSLKKCVSKHVHAFCLQRLQGGIAKKSTLFHVWRRKLVQMTVF